MSARDKDYKNCHWFDYYNNKQNCQKHIIINLTSIDLKQI